MAKRILFVATSDIHIRTFHIPYLKWLKDYGCEIHVAVENRENLEIPYIDEVFYLDFPRIIFNQANISTFLNLQKIIHNNNYNLIHCHTPVPSAITRLAARKMRKKGTKVLYTAHGFHFFRGGPLKYWFTYYPAELFLSRYTDGIVTINEEDYNYANSRMYSTNAYYIKGIGVDGRKFETLDEKEQISLRKEFGYEEKDFILIYIAEFINRKNHQFIIDSIPVLLESIPEIKVLFAGTGKLINQMIDHTNKLKLERYVDFLGFREDVGNLAGIADIGISSSRQEGLGLGLAEVMLCSKPVVATYDRGHKEMIEHGINGFMFKQGSNDEFIKYIISLYRNADLRKKMGNEANRKAQQFKLESSLKSMIDIYLKYI